MHKHAISLSIKNNPHEADLINVFKNSENLIFIIPYYVTTSGK